MATDLDDREAAGAAICSSQGGPAGGLAPA